MKKGVVLGELMLAIVIIGIVAVIIADKLFVTPL